MELILHRKYLKNDYTIGKLYLKDSCGNQVYLCDTLEDKVRDLTKEPKVFGETAIPYGVYKISMSQPSPRFSNVAKYPKYAKYKGCLPRIMNVQFFTGVLIHIGNTKSDTDGCVIVGENKAVGKVLNSTKCFYNLMDNHLVPAYKRGEEITLSIV